MERVTSLTMDVTNTAQIRGVVESVDSLDILVNNAGLGRFETSAIVVRSISSSPSTSSALGVTQAFLPLLTRSRGAIVNVLSLAALASVPVFPGYSISKAAEFSLSQSLRTLLAGRGVRVHGVMLAPWTPT